MRRRCLPVVLPGQPMLAEVFRVATQTYILHIPYRGAGPALNDTAGGQVDMSFDNLPSTLRFVPEEQRDGLVRAGGAAW